ncbi:MAG: HAD hydrolase-like protein [Holosporaceae bacterium]|jgi:ribonucleotide monophosphatase NagD (HAD superfamily)|nr:HAD hydrolase-like protein [Holosporaceae bacterium]
MEIKDNVMSIADDYDAFFVDIYGVLFDGAVLFDGTLSTLERLNNLGKKIIILSNSTQTALDAMIGYAQRGMAMGVHYDKFVTSGEFLRHTLIGNSEEFQRVLGRRPVSYRCMFMGNDSIFRSAGLEKTSDDDAADFFYIGVPRASYGAVRVDNVRDEAGRPVKIEDLGNHDWKRLRDDHGRRGFEEFAIQLEMCLRKNKLLVVANPDIFAHGTLDHTENRYPIVTQGCLGAYYEKLGGRVIYFGKPLPGIFEYARRFVDPKDRIVMVGDTPWTDIAGANGVGIDSLLVMTGIAAEFCKGVGLSPKSAKKLDTLFGEIAPLMLKANFSPRPTYLARRFAAIN